VKRALTIAGSDSGGGAGILADAATFRAWGVWPTVAITAVTAQNTRGVTQSAPVDPALIAAQIEAIRADISIDSVKTGMLGTAAAVEAVADALRGLPAPVVDPVMVSSSGHRLLDDAGIAAVRTRLVPGAALVTPNVAEAEVLTGCPVTDRASMENAARALVDAGAHAALVTGGHLDGADCLVAGADLPYWIVGDILEARTTHGTGCVLSAAITAGLALGADLRTACEEASAYVRAAIANGVDLGAGPGAVNPPPRVSPGGA
jgi:hydroxymethylpyrimidine/phosphomethylpyrimidine kinase